MLSWRPYRSQTSSSGYKVEREQGKGVRKTVVDGLKTLKSAEAVVSAIMDAQCDFAELNGMTTEIHEVTVEPHEGMYIVRDRGVYKGVVRRVDGRWLFTPTPEQINDIPLSLTIALASACADISR